MENPGNPHLLKSVTLKCFQKYPNVGDQFSILVAREFFSRTVTPVGNGELATQNLILVGSILEWADDRTHVCGAGLISSAGKMNHTPASIQCVRGPLTAHFLGCQGISVPRAYGDPGVLAPQFFAQEYPEIFDIGVVPHYIDADSKWLNECRIRGVQVLDSLSPFEVFFLELQQCKVVLSSSLHGLIFAHAYGKPALWIEISDKVLGGGFKFFDYYLSIGVSPEQVTRVRVGPDTDPVTISKFASVADHTRLISSLDLAIKETRSLMVESIHERNLS